VSKKRIITLSVIVLVIIIIGLFWYIFYGGGSSTKQSEAPIVTSTTASSKDLGTYISSTTQLSNFDKLINAAGVSDTLKTANTNFVVLAPIDSAFNNLPNGYLDSLLTSNTQAAQDIAKYEIASVPANQLTNGQKLKTSEGQEIIVNVSGNTYTFTDAKGNTASTVAGPQKTANGTIYMVNNVLLPQ
jgi:uncharacterized surface protein with fasciclin (FAS1) repeats